MKVITVRVRPLARDNKKTLYGCTETNGDVSNIEINSKQGTQEFINTFFHEVAHSFIHWYGSGISPKEEERLARLVGDVVEPCFRRAHAKKSKRKA